MSVQMDDTYYYCSESDVLRYYERYDDITGSTDPTENELKDYIRDWSAYIDRQTGQSWRENQVLEETHDGKNLYYWLSGQPINLMKREIVTPLDDTKGDKLEVWTGNEWEEWVSSSTYEEGRDKDYWVDGPVGKLWIYERNILRPHPKFRVTYRYGAHNGVTDSDSNNVPDNVPRDIRKACAKLVASDLLTSDIWGVGTPGTETDLDIMQTAQRWEEQAERVISQRKKVHFV